MARNDWKLLGQKVKSYPANTGAQFICDDITGRLSNSAQMRPWADRNDWIGVTVDQVTYAQSDSVQKDPILFPLGKEGEAEPAPAAEA